MIDKAKFIDLLKILVKKSDFDEANNIITEGNYSLEICFAELIWLDDTYNYIDHNEILLAIQ